MMIISAVLCLISEPKEILIKSQGTMRGTLLNIDNPASTLGDCYDKTQKKKRSTVTLTSNFKWYATRGVEG